MSAIHGIASAFCPGLGQLIGGKGKEGVKDMVTAAGASAIASAGGGLIASTVIADSFQASGQELKGVMKFFGKHKKATAFAGSLIVLGGAALAVVNWIKSIVNAGKIEK